MTIPRARFLWAGAAVALYGAAAWVLWDKAGSSVAILALVPISAVAWLFNAWVAFALIAVHGVAVTAFAPWGGEVQALVLGHGGLILVAATLAGFRRMREDLRRQVQELRATEGALRDSEERWRDLVTHVPDIVCLADRDGVILFINRPGPGYRREQVIGMSVFDFVPPERRAAERERFDEVIRTGNISDSKVEVLAGDGSRLLYSSRYGPLLQEGYIVGAVILARDITDVQTLTDLRKRFRERVVTAQEEERRRIARELHDVTGQALTSLLVRLRTLEDLDDLEQVRERIRDLRSLTSKTIDDVGRLARGLHPTVLDDLGFAAALDRARQEFARAYGVSADLQLIGLDGDAQLPMDVQLALYRIMQEALTNVGKHSRAKMVSIIVEKNSRLLRAIVEDDGEGFVIDERTGMPAGSSGLGMIGIRERAELISGSVTVESAPGTGTTLFVNIPLN